MVYHDKRPCHVAPVHVRSRQCTFGRMRSPGRSHSELVVVDPCHKTMFIVATGGHNSLSRQRILCRDPSHQVYPWAVSRHKRPCHHTSPAMSCPCTRPVVRALPLCAPKPCRVRGLGPYRDREPKFSVVKESSLSQQRTRNCQ